MRVYALGGLGVDKRVFENFEIEGELIILKWPTPFKQESLEDYILRLAKKISSDKPFDLVGVSFGGMMVMELCKIVEPRHIIIISSVATKNELPSILKLASIFKLNRWVPTMLLKPPYFIANYLFGVKSKKHQQLLNVILRETNDQFLRWAIGIILNWENEQVPLGIFRIHGSHDKILPHVHNEATVIEGAGHFMIVTHAALINQMVNDKLRFKP